MSVGGQGVKGQFDLIVLVQCRGWQLFGSGVAVRGQQREVVEVAVQLGHQVVGAAGLAGCVLPTIFVGWVDAGVALGQHH